MQHSINAWKNLATHSPHSRCAPARQAHMFACWRNRGSSFTEDNSPVYDLFRPVGQLIVGYRPLPSSSIVSMCRFCHFPPIAAPLVAVAEFCTVTGFLSRQTAGPNIQHAACQSALLFCPVPISTAARCSCWHAHRTSPPPCQAGDCSTSSVQLETQLATPIHERIMLLTLD